MRELSLHIIDIIENSLGSGATLINVDVIDDICANVLSVTISDNVGTDEGEPEVLFDGLHHAREHLSAETPIYILDLLAGQYRKKTDLGRRVTDLVNKRRTWIVFMVNPDGLQYDLGGNPYRAWRKNRQPTPGSSADRGGPPPPPPSSRACREIQAPRPPMHTQTNPSNPAQQMREHLQAVQRVSTRFAT